jgi:thiosulfate reductase/polysulfide reductase chain A
MAEKVVRTVCQGCHSECGVLVHADGGNISKITSDPDHPSSRGYICIKGTNYALFTYHPDRLKYPLRRAGKKGEGKWERISWDEALDEIAAKLTEIREKYGVRSIGGFQGTAPRESLFSTRLFAAALGTPQCGQHGPSYLPCPLNGCGKCDHRMFGHARGRS